jgi:peptide/nickel transport system permease protein
MAHFFLKSFGQKLITLLLVSVVSFLVIKLAPGDPSQINPLNPRFTQADLERYRKAFDLDKPLHQQYVLFYKKFFTGKLVSFKDNQPVLGKIWERFLNSLWLFVLSVMITWSLAFPTGIFGAIKRGSKPDRAITIFAYALISIPSFVMAYVLIVLVVKYFNLPVLGMTTFGQEDVSTLYRVQDRLWHMVLPALISASLGVAYLSRYVREQMIEVMGQDYIRTARAKGCSESSVYYRHALRNGLLPFVTMFGLIIPGFLGGSVIIETIFAWPGMGRMGYEALLARDYPIIISLNFISAILVLMGTFVSDVLYMLVDPRIKL